MQRIFGLLYTVLTGPMQINPDLVRQALTLDYRLTGQKGRLEFDGPKPEVAGRTGVANKRQQKHLPETVKLNLSKRVSREKTRDVSIRVRGHQYTTGFEISG